MLSPSPAALPARSSSADGGLRDAPLGEFVASLRDWLDEESPQVLELLAPQPDFELRVAAAAAMRRRLFDAGWGRYGWPEAVGGLGGSILHRCVVHEELTRRGWPGPANLEHLEIIAPALVRYADADFAAEVLPAFLAGDEAWAQGFSEPDAGSDLASLRTRAEVLEDGDLAVTGRKLWTTWAKWARWAIVLVRTGTTEQRHRGLTMVAVDLHAAGVQVIPIRQANGTDELAEVVFDQVRVPRRQMIGTVGGGWEVAFYLLAYERATLAWPRHTHFLERFGAGAALATSADDRDLGEVLVELAGLRAVAASSVLEESTGGILGPRAAYTKLLMTRSEQSLYELLRRLRGPGRMLMTGAPDDELVAQEHLFSKIVTVYGGSREMQLTTVAHRILGLGG